MGFLFCNRFCYSKFEHSKVEAIHEIVVAPEHRHGGIGKTLIESAMKCLKSEKVELWVGMHNKKAMRFYQSLGFIEKERT